MVANTENGKIARHLAKFRPEVPVVAVTPSAETQNALMIQRGVICYTCDENEDIDDQIKFAIAEAKKNGITHPGARIIAITASAEDTPEENIQMRVLTIE